METKINLPDIGTEDALEVTEILVKIGDKVNVEDSLITVEGNKTSIEIPSPINGIITDIKVEIGNKVKTGQIIMLANIETMPIYNNKENIINITKNTEDHTVNNKLLPINKCNKNNINTLLKPIDSNVEIKNIDNLINQDDNIDILKKNNYIHATPLIRRIAHLFDIDLAKIKGTGRLDRILLEDVKLYIKNINKYDKYKYSVENIFSSFPINLTKNFKKFGDIEEIELSNIQKKSGNNLHKNWLHIPHVTQFDEVDITNTDIFRQNINDEYKQKNIKVKITLLVFIIKSVAKALKKFPNFNSSLSNDSKKLILKKYINVGIAIDTKLGLFVPVLRNIDKKNILDISYEILEISEKARDGKLNSFDMQGGNFTISNLGGVGGGLFTPIINAPEIAILGVSKSVIKPIWNGKKFIPRMILPLSLSYDHRIVNGVKVVQFMKYINSTISDIRLLLM